MKIGLIAGSFDPVTFGHINLFQQAVDLVDKLYIVVSQHPTKKHYLPMYNRRQCVLQALGPVTTDEQWHRVEVLAGKPKDLTVDLCTMLGATVMFRGLRDATDFQYERNLGQYNRDLAPHITTVYLMTPPELAHISSSGVRSLVGQANWKTRIAKYVHASTIHALAAQQNIIDKGYTVVQ